jgi:hypothetical protein
MPAAGTEVDQSPASRSADRLPAWMLGTVKAPALRGPTVGTGPAQRLYVTTRVQDHITREALLVSVSAGSITRDLADGHTPATPNAHTIEGIAIVNY